MATSVNLSFELVGMIFLPEVLQSSPRLWGSTTFQAPYHSFSSVVSGGMLRNSSSTAWGNIARWGRERGWEDVFEDTLKVIMR